MAAGETIALGIASILVIGVGAQLLAHRLHLPSILLLLLAGFIAGATGFLDADALLGDLLLPIVSISVAVVLFEGSLGLDLHEILGQRTVVRRLLTWGALVSALLTTWAAYALAGLPLGLSLLLGVLLVVTGPTVVGPLLRQMRLTGPAGNVLKWEGILIDPVGAIGAVLVFEGLLAGSPGQQTATLVSGLLGAVLTGGIIGALIAVILIALLRYRLVPDTLQNPATLAIVVGGFVLSEVIRSESGLLTVTLAGILLANQSKVRVKHIIEFKENLRVLLIGGLFIVLASRVELESLKSLRLGDYLFVAALILLIRPASVYVATLGSNLGWRVRLFLASMAPRGIVAAAIASLFSLRLAEEGVVGAERLLPLTFLVIVGTILVYALGAPILARRLGLAAPDANGVLLVGAQPWARDLAVTLREHEVRVLMADSNPDNAMQARVRGIPSYEGSVLTEHAMDDMDMTGLGSLYALTPNDEVNALATLHFADEFGRDHVYLLAPRREKEGTSTFAEDLRGRVLFDEHATHPELAKRFAEGQRSHALELDADAGETFTRLRAEGALLLFISAASGKLMPFTPSGVPPATAGDVLIYLGPPETAP